jgi:hypothetical protein
MNTRARTFNTNVQNRLNRPSGGVRTLGNRTGNMQNNRRRMDRKGNFQKRTGGNRFGNKPRDYCSLCGKYDHKAVDGCPYMVNDSGRKVPIMPCKDTCPSYIRNGLNHPRYICPFRSNYGPLCNKMTNQGGFSQSNRVRSQGEYRGETGGKNRAISSNTTGIGGIPLHLGHCILGYKRFKRDRATGFVYR